MAQQDTGMGWNAKDTYLLFSAQSLLAEAMSLQYSASMSPTPYPGQAPVAAPTAADVIANGTYAGFFRSGGVTFDIYLAATVPNVLIYCHLNEFGYPYYWGFFSTDPSARGLKVQGGALETCEISTDIGGGIYYGEVGQANSWAVEDLRIYPQTTDPTTLYSSLVTAVQTSYYKLNEGYAVACVARWITIEGNTLTSPVLISTAPLATAITEDGTAPSQNMTTFDYLYQGLRFYMTIIGGNSLPLSTALEYANLEQYMAALPQKVFSLLVSESYANVQISDASDPYGDLTDPSEPDGGQGDPDPEDDPVTEETLPIPAVTGLGFSTIYVPTQTDLYNLAAYLWGGNLDLDNFLKLFANPMDSILGLSAVPLVLSGTYEPVYLGGQLLQNITLPRYTGRSAVKVDMGSVTIDERWGSYLDYDPYTELSIYLPFIGIKNIKADDVMGKTVQLMYDIDILSGACLAYLRPVGGSVLYEWSGQCAMQIPITGSNWDNIFSTAISTAATLGGALFAPASAPVLGGAVASAASQAIAAKPRIERSGAMNGVTGFLGQLRPYIIRTIPEAYIPSDQNKFIGYPSYVSVDFSTLQGYNEIASVHLENIPATGDELTELESILKGGAIF